MRIKTIICIALSFVATGCATVSPPPPPPPSRVSGDEAAAISENIFRYVGVDVANWPQDGLPSTFDQFYTSIVVKAPETTVGIQPGDADGNPRDYAAEKVGFFKNIFVDQKKTVTAVANVAVSAPELKATIPLFSITHTSGRKIGNTWETGFTSSNLQSPLFLISPNSKISVTLKGDVSSQLTSHGAATTILAVTKAVQLAAPKASVLTKLSAPDVNNAASALDTVISSLSTNTLVETISFDRNVSQWSPGSIINMTACAPFSRVEKMDSQSVWHCGDKADIDGQPTLQIGTWTMALSCPRPSAFDSRDICEAIQTNDDDGNPVTSIAQKDNRGISALVDDISTRVTSGSVLSFRLTGATSVKDFVTSQDWYSTFIAIKTPKAGDLTTFCAAAATGVQAQGISSFDSAIVLRAMIEGLPQLVNTSAQFAGADGAGCKALLAVSHVALRL